MRKKQTEKAKSGNAYKKADGKSYIDDRIWTIGKDSNGNGKATIRLLPSYNKAEDDINSFVTRAYHSINTVKPGVDPKGADKSDKRWRMFLCPGEDCPVCAKRWELYNEAKDNDATKDELKGILSAWSPQEENFTNILVVKDPINEENNGKVKLYKVSGTVLGICDKETERVNDVMIQYDSMTNKEEKSELLADEGIDEGITTFDAYDMINNGKNINLVYKNKKDPKWTKPTDYWGSSAIAPRFSSVIKINTDGLGEDEIDDLIDEKAEKLLSQTYCLDEFEDPNNFEGAKQTIPTNEELELNIKYLMWEIDSTKPTKKKENKETKEVDEETKEETPKKMTSKERLLKKKAKIEDKEEAIETEPDSTDDNLPFEEDKVEDEVEVKKPVKKEKEKVKEVIEDSTSSLDDDLDDILFGDE